MTTSVLKLSSGAAPATPGAGTIAVYPNANNILTQIDQNANAIPLIGGGAFSCNTPADPTGTTDTTGKMMGLAQTVTPQSTGRISVSINGTLQNSTGADGAKAQIRYGTGTAPANAAALTGTVIGTFVQLDQSTNANQKYPFSLTAGVTGLTLGTAYWVDIQLAAVTGGTASAKSLTVTIEEV